MEGGQPRCQQPVECDALAGMRPLSRYLLLPSMLLVIVALAGCADEEQPPPSAASPTTATSSASPSSASPSTADPSSSPSPTPVPKTVSPQRSAYVREANTICSDATDELLMLRPPLAPEDLPGLIEQTLEINDRTLDQLEELEAPPGDADRLQAEFLDKARGQQQEVEGVLREVQAAVEAKDEQQLQAAGQRLRAISDPAMAEFLGGYGLLSCRDLGVTGGT